MSSICDVLIIGAGVMGAALGYWLTRFDSRLRVMLVERDTTYATASSALSASSIRQQFSQPVNVALSLFGIEFLRAAGELLEARGERPQIGLVEPGYLVLAREAQAQALGAAHAMQRELGAAVALLDRAALRARFSWLHVDDLALGALGERGEGWFDGPALLHALLRKARAQGVTLERGEVVAIEHDRHRVHAAVLGDGRRIRCAALVNAAGPWAARIAAMAGIELPVRARQRTVFVLGSPARLQPCPLVVDPDGVWFRPEGQRYIAGLEPGAQVAPEALDDGPLRPRSDRFDALWLKLAHRVPQFEALRFERAWAGYYEMNLLDHNAVVGAHPELGNMYFINGFSGHGMQHAPGAARGLAELLVHGRFVTLDLGPLGFERILERRPLIEANVIG